MVESKNEPFAVDESQQKHELQEVQVSSEPDQTGDHTLFSSEGKEHVTVTWENLCFKIGHGDKKKEVLHNLSGHAKPGDLMAIMGPSGAGKSTLMNVLASRAPYGKAAGTIDVNGLPPKKMRKKIAYVMQEDALFATQTPRETFAFTAALKLPELSDAERSELVESVLTALGLQTCADTMVGSLMIKGISGGEKKRTSIGVELISSPSVIFLDEPTSGLDSHSAFEVVKHLRALAKSGSTIVCTIHQPSSEVFDVFNKVLLLRDGYSLYNGHADGLLPHFAGVGLHCNPNYNPADFAMHSLQTANEEVIKQLMDDKGALSMVEPEEHDSDNEDATPALKSSYATQLYYLTKRESMQFLRDKPTLGARYGMAVILALLTGIFFFQVGDEWGEDGRQEDITIAISNHWGGLVFISINALFLSAQPMLLVFPTERPVFMREYATGTYATIPYFVSKTLIEIPASLLQTLVQYVVCYFMLDLGGNFFYLLVPTFLLGLVTSSIALWLSASTTRAETAVNIMPAIYVPQILASGFFISSKSMPAAIAWTQWICPLKYGLALATLGELSSKYVPEDREVDVAYVLNDSDIHPDDWWMYAIILVGMFFFFRITAAIVLSRRAKHYA
eukprot:gene2331-3611_t